MTNLTKAARHPSHSTPAGPCLGPAVINGQVYTGREVMQVARVTYDGTTCTVAASDLLEILGDGVEYAVRLETMRVSEFEQMDDFAGW